jgi:hypothetical protein
MKIDIAIIGAEKCGTTSLKEYLGALPQVRTHFDKECAYFLQDSSVQEPLESYFPSDCEGRTVVLKNVGILESPEALRRLVDHSPHVKTVVMLRDPVKRAVSAHAFARRNGVDTRPRLVDCLDPQSMDTSSYLERSRYESSLPEVFRLIGPDQVYVGSVEQLKNEPDEFMKELLDWLGLEYADLPERQQHNRAMQARSLGFARLIRARFPLRGAVRRLVPYPLRVRVINALKRLNEKPLTTESALSAEEIESLRKHFSQTYAFVARHYPSISSAWGYREPATSQVDVPDQ